VELGALDVDGGHLGIRYDRTPQIAVLAQAVLIQREWPASDDHFRFAEETVAFLSAARSGCARRQVA
jgi:hypothetical protein